MAEVFILLCTISAIAALNVGMIGSGVWKVMKIMKCPDHDTYPMKYEISRRKVNRTHDGFNLDANLEFTLDNSYGVLIDTCKYMDGGCKPFQVFADDCACTFLEKYGGSNMRDVFALAGVDPPECPVPPGNYSMTDYVFNYEELPEKGVYGTYDATVFLLSPKDDEGVARRLGCTLVTVDFDDHRDDDD